MNILGNDCEHNSVDLETALDVSEQMRDNKNTVYRWSIKQRHPEQTKSSNMNREHTSRVAQSEEVGGVRTIPAKMAGVVWVQTEGFLRENGNKERLGRKAEEDMITGWRMGRPGN